jgi:hypothetical protein
MVRDNHHLTSDLFMHWAAAGASRLLRLNAERRCHVLAKTRTLTILTEPGSGSAVAIHYLRSRATVRSRGFHAIAFMNRSDKSYRNSGANRLPQRAYLCN